MSKDYKQFDFNSKEDYLFVFYNLIAQAYQLLHRYRKYCTELNQQLLKLEQQKMVYIDEDIYSEWHDKILSVSRGLITIFVDDAKGVMSYVRIRKFLEKTKYRLEPIDKFIKNELDELRDVRNWSYHLPQTNFVAMKEVYYKSIPKELHKYVEYNFNPIKVSITEKCNIELLESLYIHSTKRLEIFDKILKNMIFDFEMLLGQKVTIVEVSEKPLELLSENMATTQLSMAMNRRKYDGSNKSYERITFQKPVDNEE